MEGKVPGRFVTDEDILIQLLNYKSTIRPNSSTSLPGIIGIPDRANYSDYQILEYIHRNSYTEVCTEDLKSDLGISSTRALVLIQKYNEMTKKQFDGRDFCRLEVCKNEVFRFIKHNKMNTLQANAFSIACHYAVPTDTAARLLEMYKLDNEFTQMQKIEDGADHGQNPQVSLNSSFQDFGTDTHSDRDYSPTSPRPLDSKFLATADQRMSVPAEEAHILLTDETPPSAPPIPPRPITSPPCKPSKPPHWKQQFYKYSKPRFANSIFELKPTAVNMEQISDLAYQLDSQFSDVFHPRSEEQIDSPTSPSPPPTPSPKSKKAKASRKKKVKNTRNSRNQKSKKKISAKDIKCPHCPKLFRCQWRLSEHMNVHTGAKPHLCQICSKGFASKSNMRAHTKIHAKKGRQVSLRRRFVEVKNVVLSEETGTGNSVVLKKCRENVERVICGICDKEFATKRTLKTHVDDVHAGQARFKCSVCAKLFSTLGNKKRHERAHTGKRDQQCDQCDAAFTTRSQLLGHKKFHGGKKYACDQCAKSFVTKQHLDRHQKGSHLKERCYTCESCDAGFRVKQYLTRHMKIHSQPKPKRQPRKRKKAPPNSNPRAHPKKKKVIAFSHDNYLVDPAPDISDTKSSKVPTNQQNDDICKSDSPGGSPSSSKLIELSHLSPPSVPFSNSSEESTEAQSLLHSTSSSQPSQQSQPSSSDGVLHPSLSGFHESLITPPPLPQRPTKRRKTSRKVAFAWETETDSEFEQEMLSEESDEVLSDGSEAEVGTGARAGRGGIKRERNVGEMLECNQCHEKFGDGESYERHTELHSNDVKYLVCRIHKVCGIFKKWLPRSTRLRDKHERLEHDYICERCGGAFINEVDLDDHILLKFCQSN